MKQKKGKYERCLEIIFVVWAKQLDEEMNMKKWKQVN